MAIVLVLIEAVGFVCAAVGAGLLIAGICASTADDWPPAVATGAVLTTLGIVFICLGDAARSLRYMRATVDGLFRFKRMMKSIQVDVDEKDRR